MAADPPQTIRSSYRVLRLVFGLACFLLCTGARAYSSNAGYYSSPQPGRGENRSPPRQSYPRQRNGPAFVSEQKNIAVLGAAGYSGAVTYGFLQRASNQYGLGIDDVAVLGATMETSRKLNRVLAKSFLHAYADDEALLLANLFSVEAVAEWLQDFDALILGTDLGVAVRQVTPGTYNTRNGATC